jgi:hypothetical protein
VRQPSSARRGLAAAALAGLLLGASGGFAPLCAAPEIPHQVAVLQGLDKVTARVSEFTAPLDQPVRFGALEVMARTCLTTPPTEPPESAAFLEVREVPPAADATVPPEEVFTGWMFASSPALSALEHPVYDIWVVGCDDEIASEADQGDSDGTGPASE